MCDEKLNLAKLLSSCPKGTKLWSPLFGEVTFEFVEKRNVGASIVTSDYCGSPCRFSEDGTYYQGYKDAECVLFPSKECRDWSKFSIFKEGDFLANEDGRAFIFRGKFTHMGYPMAYGGVDTCDNFIPSEDNKAWSGTSFRFATTDEINVLQTKMEEAGYMWDANQKVLKKDLPVDTLVAVCDTSNSDVYFHSMAIRRYAGEHKCFNNNGGSKSSSSSTWWRHIIPLDKLTVNKEGIVELDKVTDYGTHNYYA